MSNDTTATDSTARPTGEPPRERLLHEIVSLVAEANDCDPLDLSPVSNVVDPDALEALLTGSNAAVTVRFAYGDGRVRVSETGVEFESETETEAD